MRDSLYGKTFPTPKKGFLTVGEYIPTHKGKQKKYTVTCSICSNDSELFSKPLTIDRSSLLKGGVPCGCSRSPNWSQYQQVIRLKRVCAEQGFNFLGLAEEYKGKDTKVILSCPNNHMWNTSTLHSIIRKRNGCPKCEAEDHGVYCRRKPEHATEIISKLVSDKGGEFIKWEEGYKNNHSKFQWRCKEGHYCSTSFTNFREGRYCPICANKYYEQAYINLIEDSGIPIGLKFGISKDSNRRLLKQNSKSLFKVKNLKVFHFISSRSCVEAEKEVKKLFNTCLMSKREFPDGYTETTSVKNLEEIIKVFKNFGGIEIR